MENSRFGKIFCAFTLGLFKLSANIDRVKGYFRHKQQVQQNK